MGFKGRLSRLPAPRVGLPATEIAENKVDLSALRAEMARLLALPQPDSSEPASIGKSPPDSPATRLGVDQSDLPFVAHETEAGPVLRRLARYGPAHQIGRASTSAWVGNSQVLSLLALDPSLAGQDLARALFFDTETTGLGGAGSMAFLVGLGWFGDDGCFMLEQLLLEEPSQEVALLGRLRQLIDESHLLVSFNGKSFDWPLLQARCVMRRLPPLPVRPHLDLLHVARRVHKRRLARTNLRALEEQVLGFDRGDGDVAGADIPARYAHFLRTGDAEALLAIVQHNAWDVLSMGALLSVYGEPLDTLGGLDLLGVAETLHRARDLDRALEVVTRLLEHEPSPPALHVRAKLHKARGDRARALVDFESILAEVDDPVACLELCKLYEHHAKDYQKALALLAQGTGETAEAAERRRLRLDRRARAGKAPL